MIHKIKMLLVVAIASAGALALFSGTPVFAQGETWKLTSNTTIQVSGGLFNGQNGNPSSVTLTLQNPGVDPPIWVNTSAFNLKKSNGSPIEGQPRNSGQFCITTLNTTSLTTNRTSVDFKPIHRDDCNKGAAARYIDNSSLTCGSATSPWPCNTLWQSSAAQHIDTNSKVTYAVAGAPLKCGDPGFMGPCQTPINYATADCTKTDGTPGQAEKCQAIKGCIVGANKAEAECTKAWDDCIATWAEPGAGYNSCKSTIEEGDLTGGRSVGATATGSESTCKIDAIGWIICPVATFMGGIVDAAYSWITSLLTVPPLSMTMDTSNPTFAAWSIMRNFANVAFVIAFLMIVFSQMTSVGLSNYGIKRMLPRLIVAAILVNASYFICAIAVDISNILGHSFYTLLGGVEDQLAPINLSDAGATGEGWLGLVGLAIGGGAAVAGLALLGPSIILPALIAALLAIVTVFLVLTLRQALIILLIFISPLAFVAYLLPNTESLFKKWLGLFKTLLLMYPIISIIFGASAVASTVIMKSSPTLAVQVMGALVSIIPLALTPIIMKTAGGVLNRFGGMVNNPTKGPFDRMKKGAAGIRSRELNSMNNKAIGRKFSARGAWQRRSARVEAIDQNQQRELTRSKAAYIADATANNTMSASQKALNVIPGVQGKGLQDQMVAGNGQAARDRAESSAMNTLDQLEVAEVKAATVVFDNLNLDRNQKRTLEQGGEISVNGRSYQGGNMQKAALANAVNEQRFADIEDAMKSPTNANDAGARAFLANNIKSNYATTKAGAAHLVDPDMLRRFVDGSTQITETDLNAAAEKAMEGMAASLMATQKGPSLTRIEAIKVSDPTALGSVRAAATAVELQGNRELFDKMGQAERNTVVQIGR